jgi:hypothetical protein
MLYRALRKRGDKATESLGKAAGDRVREGDRALEARCSHELDCVVGNRVRRSLAPRELVARHAQCGPYGRVELPYRATAEPVDSEVDRPNTLHGSVGDALGEAAVSRVEPGRRDRKGPVGIGVVLENAANDLESRLPGRSDHARTPRKNSS